MSSLNLLAKTIVKVAIFSSDHLSKRRWRK